MHQSAPKLDCGFMRCDICNYDVCSDCIPLQKEVIVPRKRMEKVFGDQGLIFCHK